MEAVAILGAGGHGHDIADIARACGMFPIFYDDGNNAFVLCEYAKDPSIVGVNDPSTRRRLAVGSTPTRLVHPTAVVSPSAVLSPGVVVGAGSLVGPGTVLGPHVHLGAGCTVTRTKVGGFTTIAPGVDIAGDVSIGEECLIGVGSTVSNLVSIGDRCVVGAGAVVVDNIPDDTTVVGIPARPLQRREHP